MMGLSEIRESSVEIGSKANPRILIIEDEPKMVDFIKLGLTYEGFEVDYAYDGKAGLKLALENQPDLIILDLMLPGLWATAIAQAETAALNAVGSDELYKPPVPVTMLKVVGIDLTSIGTFEPSSAEDRVIVFKEVETLRYRKLVISNGKIVGAILIGYPQDAPAVIAAVKNASDVTPLLEELYQGRWQQLAGN